MSFFFALLSLGVIGWVSWSMYADYQKTPGESLFTAFRNSVTLVGAKGLTLLFAVAELVQTIDPELRDTVKGALEKVDPTYAGAFVAAFPVLFWVLRLRGMKG